MSLCDQLAREAFFDARIRNAVDSPAVIHKIEVVPASGVERIASAQAALRLVGAGPDTRKFSRLR